MSAFLALELPDPARERLAALFRSVLSHAGAAYTPVERFALRQASLDPSAPPGQHAAVREGNPEA